MSLGGSFSSPGSSAVSGRLVWAAKSAGVALARGVGAAAESCGATQNDLRAGLEALVCGWIWGCPWMTPLRTVRWQAGFGLRKTGTWSSGARTPWQGGVMVTMHRQPQPAPWGRHSLGAAQGGRLMPG